MEPRVGPGGILCVQVHKEYKMISSDSPPKHDQNFLSLNGYCLMRCVVRAKRQDTGLL